MSTGVTAVAGAPRGRGRASGSWWAHHRARADDVALQALVLLGVLPLLLHHHGRETTALMWWVHTAHTWWRIGLTLAVAVCLRWRRRRPVLLALSACVAVALGASALALWATFLTLAIRHRDRSLVLAAAAALTATGAVDRDVGPALSSWLTVVALPVAMGSYIGARRDLVASLRERAERAEAEQLLRAGQARLSERTRIAREMHDVLAHRISLVALHAGGLEVDPAVGPAAVERSAALIRTTAHQALEDLRDVLGVLRADDAVPVTTGPHPDLLPQPTLADVDRLVRASAEAGVVVRLHEDLPPASAPPPLVGRTAYRVVQEGLTNVHKHATGATAAVRLSGGPGRGLRVKVRNARPVGATAAPAVPGASLGLVGLRERVELVGGGLRTGPQPDGSFSVRADLPWPDARGGAA